MYSKFTNCQQAHKLLKNQAYRKTNPHFDEHVNWLWNYSALVVEFQSNQSNNKKLGWLTEKLIVHSGASILSAPGSNLHPRSHQPVALLPFPIPSPFYFLSSNPAHFMSNILGIHVQCSNDRQTNLSVLIPPFQFLGSFCFRLSLEWTPHGSPLLRLPNEAGSTS